MPTKPDLTPEGRAALRAICREVDSHIRMCACVACTERRDVARRILPAAIDALDARDAEIAELEADAEESDKTLATMVDRLKKACGSPSGMSLPEDFERALTEIARLLAVQRELVAMMHEEYRGITYRMDQAPEPDWLAEARKRAEEKGG